jgi:hypothetical protein
MNVQTSQLRSDAFDSSSVKQVICRTTVRECVNRLGSSLQALILTGSQARNEGSVVLQGRVWRVLGDAEFVLVFARHARMPKASEVHRLCASIDQALLAEGIQCAIGLSAVRPSFLTGAAPSIFSLELKERGEVLWGEPQILDTMPSFSATGIPLEDAWRLLQNRIVEMLQLPGEFEGRPVLSQDVYYRTIKLCLDMATSLLVFLGEYAPGYREREQRLRSLAQDVAPPDLPFALEPFSRMVSDCTRRKLNVDQGVPACSPACTIEFWAMAVFYARQLWRWELCRMTGIGPEATDRELMVAWMSRRPLSERAIGWLVALRHEGLFRSLPQLPRWASLARKASPRYWIYAAASDFLFTLAETLKPGSKGKPGPRCEQLLQELPLRAPTRTRCQPCGHVAAEIFGNYTSLLVETRR